MNSVTWTSPGKHELSRDTFRRPRADDQILSALGQGARSAVTRVPSRLRYQCMETVTEEDLKRLKPLDLGGRRKKAGMLFASVVAHTKALLVNGNDKLVQHQDPVDWDRADSQVAMKNSIASDGEDLSSKGPSSRQDFAFAQQVSEEELAWRGSRDAILFTLILMLAGGPGEVLRLMDQGLAASAEALRQAHTHPQIIFFTLSLLPFLAFIAELWFCGRETQGVTLAFASLLVFVVAGIPLESYTESTYGDLLSNVDSIHFAAQSLVSATNLAILLAFQDATSDVQRSIDAACTHVQRAQVRADASLLGALSATAVAGAFAAKYAGSQLVMHSSSGIYPLMCVLLPTAMGGAWLGLAAKPQPSAGTSHRPVARQIYQPTLQQALWVATGLLATAAALAPGRESESYLTEPANALSVATWSVHVLSILEWSVAMALTWQYAEAVRQPQWKGLAWGMLPLHGSGLCAITFHLWYNSPELDWLISLQAFLTLMGNTTSWIAARRIRLANRSQGCARGGRVDDV